jgi:hypothetical protein
MLIGLRFLLMFAVFAIGVAFLTYLFTKRPPYLLLAKNLVKLTLGVAVLVAVIYVLEPPRECWQWGQVICRSLSVVRKIARARVNYAG